jgi:thiol-disulfide isomerase/thioredoxin
MVRIPKILSGSALAAVMVVMLAAAPSQAQSYQENPLLLDIAPNPVAAYNFETENLDGDTIKLSDFRGKVVFLNFWATWCVPCLQEMPAMDRLNKMMAGKPFKMLVVNQAESQEKIEAFLARRKFKFSFEILLDRLGEIGGTYGVDRLPLSYIIDQNGFVIRRAIGAREWDSLDAVKLFNNLMDSLPAQKAAGRTNLTGQEAPRAPLAAKE